MPVRPPFLLPIVLAGCAAALFGTWAPPAEAIEFGRPQVISQNGQRLKIQVPYSATPSERLSVTRFSVRSIRLDGGVSQLTPNDLSIAQPADGRYLVLQSHDVVDASSVTLEVAVHDDRSAPGRFALPIPASRAAATIADEAPAQVRPVARGATHRVARAARPAAHPVAKATARPETAQRRRPARKTASSM